MLKAPLLIPRTYISRSSKIDPTDGRYYFSYFWTNLGLFFQHIIRPKIENLCFWNFRPILSSWVQQLQYNTQKIEMYILGNKRGCFQHPLNKNKKQADSKFCNLNPKINSLTPKIWEKDPKTSKFSGGVGVGVWGGRRNGRANHASRHVFQRLKSEVNLLSRRCITSPFPYCGYQDQLFYLLYFRFFSNSLFFIYFQSIMKNCAWFCLLLFLLNCCQLSVCLDLPQYDQEEIQSEMRKIRQFFDNFF